MHSLIDDEGTGTGTGTGEVGIHSRRGEFSSLLQADRVVNSIEITYANKATQVDIQRLKVHLDTHSSSSTNSHSTQSHQNHSD